MKAAELRIGNLVYAFEDKQPIIWTIDGYNLYYPAKFEPIPLTEEWLLKFGFGKTSEYAYNYYVKANVTIKGGDNFYCIGVKIEYIHQLQNLYFALTGEELIIAIA